MFGLFKKKEEVKEVYKPNALAKALKILPFLPLLLLLILGSLGALDKKGDAIVDENAFVQELVDGFNQEAAVSNSRTKGVFFMKAEARGNDAIIFLVFETDQVSDYEITQGFPKFKRSISAYVPLLRQAGVGMVVKVYNSRGELILLNRIA